MAERVFTADAKISSKGQITIPKEVREALGVDYGGRITFVVIDKDVKIVNSLHYAMKVLQTEMSGEAEKVGLVTEEDINSYIREIRKSSH